MKKLIAAILVIVICISLCACGKESSMDKERNSKNEVEVWVLTGLNLPDIYVPFNFNIEYDKNNYATVIEFSANSFRTVKAEYEYNDRGLVTACYTNIDGSISSNFYTYDKFGNQIDPNNDYVYHENGTIDFVYANNGSTVIGYTYDENGNLLTIKSQSNKSSGSSSYYTYTANGKKASETFYWSEEDEQNNIPGSQYFYEYDQNGVVCKVTCEYFMQSHMGIVYEPIYKKIYVSAKEAPIIERQQEFILEEVLSIVI